MADSPIISTREFDSEEKCVTHLASLRWPNGPVCQHCGGSEKTSYIKARNVFWCGDCRRQFSVRAGTIFEGSRSPLGKWLAAIRLATSQQGIGPARLAKHIDVTQTTARLMLGRMRDAMNGVSRRNLSRREERISGIDRMSTDTLHIPLPFEDALTAFSGPPQAAERPGVTLIPGDAREALTALPDESVHMVLTDPPYFIDGLDSGWRKGGADAVKGTGSVGGLPVGMKFDPKQGRALQAFMADIGEQWMRLLMPGGFALVFSQPRLAHRIAVALEDAGFEIRDQICWRFTKRAQFKAFKQDHFVERMNIPESEKRALIRSMGGRRTPQLRPQFEAVILAQKPKVGTFVENWQAYEVGLMDAASTLDAKVPANVMTCEKPSGAERGATNGHLTPKPVKLLEHMIELFTKPGQTVLDCFLGSGSTAVAALRTRRNCIGIEINPDYIEIARQRMGDR